MSYTWLPPLLNEIADVAGVEAAIKLVEARGGSRVSLPARPKGGHWLVKTVGREAAEKICAHFRVGNSGQVIDLPVGPSGTIERQRRMIDQMLKEGVSIDKVAATLHVHRTTVSRRRRALMLTPRQRDLFDE